MLGFMVMIMTCMDFNLLRINKIILIKNVPFSDPVGERRR